MKKLLFALLALTVSLAASAQRFTDKLDRGLIAQKADKGVYVSWRILPEEYYDVKYNVYRDGQKINSEPLRVSNFSDAGGSVSSRYTVAAVVNGVEQAQSGAAAPWSSSYMEINLKHEGIASTLVPNDACCADVDGDGQVEFLMKFDNQSEMAQSYPKNGPVVNGKATGEYSIFEIFKLNGKRLWWVNCGPNMGDFQNNEQNIVGYDWNMDGKAEVIMRLEEGSSIHMADGSVYTIGADGKNGTSWYNYRGATGGGTNWFMCVGKEFLVYCDGETGKVLDIIDYPLARLEPGETDLNAAWGDGYGHRASKFFFGAPYLNGKTPSIFLARGIYTQIKMCAFDVNLATNKLVKRWDWRQTSGGFWMWQGYHNFGIADVDMDGRDEIVYGSMVVDDNGKGLSTTGLGHGDAQHCGDFNPYMPGLEIYACNEDQPGNNYRDATTSKIYHRFNSGNDDGRAMMDNFSDQWPGAIGCSAREGAISSVTNEAVAGMDATGINTNFRIYWDGDLCSETFNYRNGKNTEGVVAKYGSWSPIYTAEGSMTNNDTKGTPCYQGDILGDWREEMVMRTANNNIRIYSTPTPTSYRIPTLWSDHQYRNAMVWQMCGYNQPPHISYFLGNMEGITQAPPPLTMTGREEVANGGTIGTSLNGKHAIVCESGNSTVTIAEGAQPSVMTFNVASWVQGTAGINYSAKEAVIKYAYYTCDVTGAGLSGDGRLVKQGDGTLKLPNAEFTHTGETNVWGGKLVFDGSMLNSPLWLNRHTTLVSNGGKFRSIKADYNATIQPGDGEKGTIETGSMNLGFGSRVVIDIFSETQEADLVKISGNLSIESKTDDVWKKAGPKYLAPVIEIVPHYADGEKSVRPGKYVIAEIGGKITGELSSIILEGIAMQKRNLTVEDGKLILNVVGLRDASIIAWTGAENATWKLGEGMNFKLADGVSEDATEFVPGDNVLFDNAGANKTVSIVGSVIPELMTVNNATYTFNGTGYIDGTAKFVKDGTGTVTMDTKNTYTGGNSLKGGTTKVTLLSNQYEATGNLGGITTDPTKFTMENGAILQTTGNVRQGSSMKMIGDEGGVINNSNDFVMEGNFTGTKLTKKGAGWLKSDRSGSLSVFEVQAGVVDASAKLANKIIAAGTADLRGSAFLTTPIEVAAGAKAVLTTVNRATTNITLSGSGQLTVWCATEKGSNYYATRTPIIFNTKDFTGTLVPQAVYSADGRFTFQQSGGSNGWTLNIPAGIIVQNRGLSMNIGALTGSGTLGGYCTFSNDGTSGTNTWNVGNESNFTFQGVVTSNDRFNKVGTGTMTVSGLWNGTGAVAINGGTLSINSGCLGTGMLTIGEDGRLMGGTALSGTDKIIKNSSVLVNGTLYPAKSEALVSTSNAIVFNNQKVTIGATGNLMFLEKSNVAEGSSDFGGVSIRNIGTLTFNEGARITVKLNPATWVPAEGDILRLWSGVKSVVGNPTVVCDLSMVAGKANFADWEDITFDTSRLSEGLLVVKSIVKNATAITNMMAAGEMVTVKAYTKTGQYVASFNTTYGNINSMIRNAGFPAGIYVLDIKSKNMMVTEKRTVR